MSFAINIGKQNEKGHSIWLFSRNLVSEYLKEIIHSTTTATAVKNILEQGKKLITDAAKKHEK